MTPYRAYNLALALVLGLGAFAVAAELYSRFLARRRGRVLDAYTAVLLLATALGVAALGPNALGRWSPQLVAVGLPTGLLLGEGASRLDRVILRRLARRRARRAVAPSRATVPAARVRPAATSGSLLLGGGGRRDPGAHRARSSPAQVDPREFPLLTVLAVAATEEAFHRGVLLHAALLPSGWLSVPLVTAAVLAFLLTHLTFGWAHVLAKAPLGLGSTVATLATGSLAPALAAHAWFNYRAWRALRPSPQGR